jgi:hypothetical protein
MRGREKKGKLDVRVAVARNAQLAPRGKRNRRLCHSRLREERCHVRLVEIDFQRVLSRFQNQSAILAVAQMHAHVIRHRWRQTPFDELAYQSYCFFAAHGSSGRF